MSNFKQQYLPVAMAAAQKYGLDPVMFAAQIEQESGWNPAAKSKAGAKGIAQFMPATAKEMGINPLDPAAALDASAKYMAQLKEQLGGDESLARQAYNGGIGTVKRVLAGKGKLPEETLNYNPAIEKRAMALSKEMGVEPTQMASAKPKMSNEQAAALAMQEMNAGLPAGALSQPTQTAQAQTQPDWAQALQQLAPSVPVAAPGDLNYDAFAGVQDLAAKNQDRVLAGMFGDVVDTNKEDTSILPGSVDRYLDKLLA